MEKPVIESEKFRREFGINNYSPIDVLSLVLDKFSNLTIFWYPMDKSVKGSYCETADDYLIFINSNQTKLIQIFTLAHELYHLLSNDSYRICTDKNSSDKIEIDANNFATSLIMPNSALYNYIDLNGIESWTYENIIKCEHFFKIDHSELLNRLKNENLINEEEYDVFLGDILEKVKFLGFDTTLYKPSSKEKQYFSLGALIPLVNEVYHLEKISKGKRDEILFDAFREDIKYNL